MMSSSSPAIVAVEKATSDLLMVPDWTMNINICDLINAQHWQAKDVIKALKKRLQHKNPKVQLLALTLLETLVKNCADHIHPHIGDKSVLGEMVKIVKKKQADVQVRSRVLLLLNAWQEAFGYQNGKRTQYFWAYEDLRRCGVQFPQVPPDAAPMFTKTVANPALRQAHIGLGSPGNSSKTLDETMATEVESLSLSVLESMRNIMELLNDMLQAVNPADRAAVKDELITDLVNGCRSNQRKLMQMLTTTRDEEVLAKGLELNDSLQITLARHDAIETGSPFPLCRSSSLRLDEATTSKSSEVSSSRRADQEIISSKPTDVVKSSPTQNVSSKDSVGSPRKIQMNEEEEEVTYDFVRLAGRHSRTSSISQTQSPSFASSEGANGTEASYAMTLTNPPEPIKTSSKEQDMIDLLSLALVPTSDPTETQPSSSPQDRHQGHTSSIDSSPQGFESYSENQVQAQLDSYVVPWAQPQSLNQQQTQVQVQYRFTPQVQYQFQETMPRYSQQPPFQPQLQTQFPTNSHPQFQSPSQIHLQPQLLAQSQLQYHTLSQPRYCTLVQAQLQPQANHQHCSSGIGFPPPPWAPTPGYYTGKTQVSAVGNGMVSSAENGHHSPNLVAQAAKPSPHLSSYSSPTVTNGSVMIGDAEVKSGPRSTATQRKPYIPTYQLFEDLNVLGNTDGKPKMTGSTSPSLSGASCSSQGIVGGTHKGLGNF